MQAIKNILLALSISLALCACSAATVDETRSGCSEEENEWGFPVSCSCGSMESESEETYDPTSGKCIDALHPLGPCTMDQNPYGHSGNCQCPATHVYNQVIGLCVAR